MNLLPVLQLLTYAVTILGGSLGVYTYIRNSRLKRAEWLHVLFDKFYESDNYKKIRHIIDYEGEELALLERQIDEETYSDTVEAFVDYLNFFEFIASLWKLRQLSLGEIRMMFEYYVVRLDDFEFVQRFVNGQGFENLSELIPAVKGGRR